MHELRDRAGAGRTDVARLIAHRVEHRFMTIEHRLIAADPDRKLAARGPTRAAAHRRIEKVHIFGGEGSVQPPHDVDCIGGKVKPGRARAKAGDETFRAQADFLDIGRRRE